MARAGIQPSDKQSETEAHSVTTLFAPSLIFCWLPKSNGEYNTALLNKILLRRSFTSKEEGQFTVAGTLLSSTKVTNCVSSEESLWRWNCGSVDTLKGVNLTNQILP